MRRTAREICWLVVFCLGLLITQAIAKPGKPVSTPPPMDFSELDNRKFTFGAQNENEVVFVPGKDGKIRFLFTELYGAKKIK